MSSSQLRQDFGGLSKPLGCAQRLALGLLRAAFGSNSRRRRLDHLAAVPVLAGLGLLAIAIGAARPAPGHLRGPLQLALSDEPALRPELEFLLGPFRRGEVMLRPAYGGEFEASPFVLPTRNSAERARAVQCLANAVYYEAAIEPVEGQRAVAQVVLNRVRDQNFPHSVCGVVYQGWERATGCQFSFTCNGALSRAPDPALFARARSIAEQALDGYVVREVGTATHYHTADIDPWWRPTLVQIRRIGAHIFYRWPGTAGAAAAFTQGYRGGEMALDEAVINGSIARPAPIAASDTGTTVMAPKTLGRIHLSALMPAGSDGRPETR